MPDGTKECSRCGKTKPEAGYSPAKWREPHGWCKACHSEYNRARYEAKGEQIKRHVRERYWADPEKARQEVRESRRRHAEARRAAARTYQKRTWSARLQYKREWTRADRAKNPRKWREKDRQERKRNPMARKAIAHRRRKIKKEMPHGTVTAVGLQARWDFYGGRCWMCGGPAVEFDHVKPLKHGGTHCHANLRPACVPCNRRKQAIWPFQRTA